MFIHKAKAAYDAARSLHASVFCIGFDFFIFYLFFVHTVGAASLWCTGLRTCLTKTVEMFLEAALTFLNNVLKCC